MLTIIRENKKERKLKGVKVSKGSRDSVSSISGVQNKTKELIRLGYEVEVIVRKIKRLVNDDKLPDLNLVEEVVRDTCKEYPDYNLIQKVVRSKVVLDINEESKNYFLVDVEKRDIISISPNRMSRLFSRNFSINDKIYTAQQSYRPDSCEILIPNENGPWYFNSYRPPEWYKNYYYSGGKEEIENCDIPEEYDKFLKHLTDGDEKSYNYILDWLSNAIRNRNHCILCTIGEKGIGKGVLGNIMANLFGEANFCETEQRILKSNFNGQLKDKKLIYCNEISVSNTREENKLKLLVDSHIEIEQKGIDAKRCPNYASIYLSSNQMDSVRLSGDNRRFSIVNLTSTKLAHVWSEPEIDNLVKNQELLAKFARYLYHREVDKSKMLKVFKSETTEEVRFLGLKDWQHWAIFEYGSKNLDKEIPISEVKEAILDNTNLNDIRPNRIRELSNLYPENVKYIQRRISGTNKREYFIKFTH